MPTFFRPPRRVASRISRRRPTLKGRAALVHYTLSADAAAYVWTAEAASLEKGYRVAADAASFTFSPQDVTFDRTYRLAADAASFTYTAEAAGLEAGYRLTANAAAFTWAPQDASLEKGYRLAADAAAFAYTAADATLKKGRTLAADAAVYVWTGGDVAFRRTYVFPVEAAAYVWTARDASLLVPQPESPTQQTGGGGGSHPSRSSRRRPPRSRVSYGAWVQVDDEDTRREREEREDQRKRAVAEEVRRSLARLAEIEHEREEARKVHTVVAFEAAGKVEVRSGELAFELIPAIALVGGGIVETGSGALAVVVRDPEQTRQRDSTAALVTEMAEMRKQMLRMKRNMDVLEVLMLAA